MPVYVLVQVLPPSVDLKILLVSLCGKPPPPSSMPAMYTSPCRVAGDLHVADEAGSDPCDWSVHVAPLSVETRDLESASANIEVVPGNIHVSEKRRGRVVVRPARFPVVAAVGMNAEMGPAIWIRGLVDLYPPKCSPASHPARP